MRPATRSPAERDSCPVPGHQSRLEFLDPPESMEASARSYSSRGDDDLSRSPARVFCLVVGATLVLVGLLGFLAESKFDTSSGGDGGALDGEKFIIFEVNGWHNVVHIASGVFLLALMRRPRHRPSRRAFVRRDLRRRDDYRAYRRQGCARAVPGEPGRQRPAHRADGRRVRGGPCAAARSDAHDRTTSDLGENDARRGQAAGRGP